MRIICTQENLNNALLIVNHLATKNANLPILSNVLISAKENAISFSTTNLEMGIKAQIRGKVEKDGAYTVPARLLADYIGLLPKENVTLEIEEDGLRVSGKNSQTLIKGMPAEDYPLIPDVSEEKQIMIKGKEMKELISQVSFAVSLDDNRPEISGDLFSFSENDCIIAATDSYRLAEKRIKVKNEITKKLIIPLKTLQELNRIIVSDDKEIQIFLSENQILFSFDGIKLVSRLIDGTYPDYEQIIPTEQKIIVELRNDQLIKAIKSAALFCKPGINDVKLSFIASKNELVVVSTNNSIGENITTIEAQVTGGDIDIVFNYRYLLDGLNNINSERILIKLNNQGAPGMFTPADNPDYLYIVMPIRQ